MFVLHPGNLIKEEIEIRALSTDAFALNLGIDPQRIERILNGELGLTPDIALQIGRFFGNDPQFWLNLQSAFDLAAVED